MDNDNPSAEPTEPTAQAGEQTTGAEAVQGAADVAVGPAPTPEPTPEPTVAPTPAPTSAPTTGAEAPATVAPDFANMTTSEVHAQVMAGTLNLGSSHSVLCSDGYYCNPNA